jgi:serine/threonine-protein kinase
VLLTTAGQIKLTDFGVAKALGKSHMTVAGQLKGKLAYMSPEQLMGGAVDRRADLFALGCVLYEITVGARPFQGEHDPQLMASIVLGRYELPSAVAPGFPLELEKIILRALASDPAQRFATADQMREALETYLRSSGPAVAAMHVAALVRERCGDALDAQSRALHAEPRPTGAPAPGPAPALQPLGESGRGSIELDRRPAERRALAWLVGAALLGAALGLGILSFVRSHRKRTVAEKPPMTLAQVDAGPRANGQPPAAMELAPVPALVPSAGPDRRSERVRLLVQPATASIVVNGVVLAPGTDSVVRPVDGGTATVLVRAEKHNDTIVLVDSATPNEVDVALVPRVAGPRRRAPSAPEAGVGAAAAAKDNEATPGAPEAPPNPYE